MRRPLALLPVLLFAAGCGQATTSSAEDFRGDERAVAEVVEDFQDAGQRGDAEEICSTLLDSALARRLETQGETCAAEIDRSMEDVDDYELVVQDVTVTGDTAQATVGRGDDEAGRAVLRFARVNGAWRATQLPAGG